MVIIGAAVVVLFVQIAFWNGVLIEAGVIDPPPDAEVAAPATLSPSPSPTRGTPPDPTPKPVEETDPLCPVHLTVEAAQTPDGMVMLTGTTTLPPGTELLASIESPQYRDLPDDALIGNEFERPEVYAGSDGTTVDGEGRWRAGPFTDDGGPLPPNSYWAAVLMPVTGNQPLDVQAIIGEDGEHLCGELVRQTVFEDLGFGPIVEAEDMLFEIE